MKEGFSDIRQLMVTVICKKIEIVYRFQGKGNILVKVP